MSNINEQVIETLKQTINHTPDIDELDLQFKQINDLLPYLQYIGQLRSLRKLNLFGNRLRQLPVNMENLESVEQLDLANNMLDKYDIQMNVQSLKTMPNLKKLSYPVSKQKQSTLIENLPNLIQLNGSKVSRKHTSSQSQKIDSYLSQQFRSSIKQINIQYENLLKLESEHSDNFSEEQAKYLRQKFQNQNKKLINQISSQYASTGPEFIQNYSKYQLYGNLFKYCTDLCSDVFLNLGTFIRHVSQQQNHYVTNIIQTTLDQPQPSFPQQHVSSSNLYEKQIRRLRKQKQELLGEMHMLQNENKKYMEIIVKYSRGEKNMVNSLNLTGNNAVKNVGNFNKSSDRPKHITNVPSHNVPSNFSTLTYNSAGTRLLTLKQLKDTIQQIYQSKLKFDQKNQDGKVPRQTMQQYLYTYLNQKYGLKTLTIENANNIISGIQAYSAEDNDVAVFGKIMRNQIDEEFRNVQSQLKSTINNLLKMHIKSQHPYKSVAEVQQIMNDKTSGQVLADQVNDIVRYLYNKTDADIIMRKLQMLFQLNKPKQITTHRRPTREQNNDKNKLKLKFSVFLKTVLDFQLKNHEKLLKPLVDVFKLKDEDADGIINEDQFIYIIEELCQEANDIMPDLLMIVDPYETRVITFTEVVKLVANYPQNNPILSRFIKSPIDQ